MGMLPFWMTAPFMVFFFVFPSNLYSTWYSPKPPWRNHHRFSTPNRHFYHRGKTSSQPGTPTNSVKEVKLKDGSNRIGSKNQRFAGGKSMRCLRVVVVGANDGVRRVFFFLKVGCVCFWLVVSLSWLDRIEGTKKPISECFGCGWSQEV